MTDQRRLYAIAAVVAAALLVYANSLWNGFAYDDTWIIMRNSRVHDVANLRSIFLTPYWPNYGPELGLYRPLTIFLFALQWSVAGNAPWFFHLTSVLAHAAVSVLVFLLVERLISGRAAFAAAILFAVHPVHTEAVSNVVGQAEIWVALAVLGASLIYVTRPEGVAISWPRRMAILSIYAAALMIKESSVVLPGLLVLLDFVQRRVPLDGPGLLRYVKAVDFMFVMLTVVLIAYLTLRLDVLGSLAGVDAAPGLPFLREEHRVLNALRAWPEYVRLLFVPIVLSVDYAPGVILPVTSVTPMAGLGALLVFSTLFITIIAPWRPRSGLIAGWFMLTILPVSNFLFPIGVLVAERTLYLPSLAVCMLAGLAWQEVARAENARTLRLATAFAALIVVGFAARTIARNPDWRSLQTVWNSLRRDHPEAYRSQWVNASEQWFKGNLPLAEQYFMFASRIWNRDSQMQKDIGSFYVMQGRYPEAVKYLEQSRAATPFIAVTHQSLAYAYLMADRPGPAIATAYDALRMSNDQKALMFATIASGYDKLGRYSEAAGAWRVVTSAKNGGLWLYSAMHARSLASAGYPQQALQIADSAFRRAGTSAPSRQAVEKLRQAIRDGCYPKGGACDALHGWTIGVRAVANRQTSAKSNTAALPRARRPTSLGNPN